EDHGDARGLGLLEHGVPARLHHRGERDDVDALRDVRADGLDLVLLLLLRVGELEVEAVLGRERVLDGLRVGGAPAGLGAHLREAEGDDAVVVAAGLAAAPGGGPRVRAARAEREQGCGRGRREDGAGQGGTCHVSSSRSRTASCGCWTTWYLSGCYRSQSSDRQCVAAHSGDEVP